MLHPTCTFCSPPPPPLSSLHKFTFQWTSLQTLMLQVSSKHPLWIQIWLKSQSKIGWDQIQFLPLLFLLHYHMLSFHVSHRSISSDIFFSRPGIWSILHVFITYLLSLLCLYIIHFAFLSVILSQILTMILNQYHSFKSLSFTFELYQIIYVPLDLKVMWNENIIMTCRE